MFNEEGHCSVQTEGHSPLCVCYFYSPVGVMFLGTRGLHEFTQPCLLSDFCKHFSHLLFHNWSDLKTKFRVIIYFSVFQSLKQCLISNSYNIGLLQRLKNYHFSGENKNIFQWRVNSVFNDISKHANSDRRSPRSHSSFPV